MLLLEVDIAAKFLAQLMIQASSQASVEQLLLVGRGHTRRGLLLDELHQTETASTRRSTQCRSGLSAANAVTRPMSITGSDARFDLESQGDEVVLHRAGTDGEASTRLASEQAERMAALTGRSCSVSTVGRLWSPTPVAQLLASSVINARSAMIVLQNYCDMRLPCAEIHPQNREVAADTIGLDPLT